MSRKILLLFFVFLIGVAGFVVWKQGKKPSRFPEPAARVIPDLPIPHAKVEQTPVVTASPIPSPVAGAGAAPVDAAPTLPQLLGVISATLEDFRRSLGENPVGSNAEIMRALNGDNSKQLKFSAPAGTRLNEEGELVDPWGTPYFFHQLSKTEMEIRSAGPDQKMWTEDDAMAK